MDNHWNYLPPANCYGPADLLHWRILLQGFWIFIFDHSLVQRLHLMRIVIQPKADVQII